MKEWAKFLLVWILILFWIILLCGGFFVVEPWYNWFTVTFWISFAPIDTPIKELSNLWKIKNPNVWKPYGRSIADIAKKKWINFSL